MEPNANTWRLVDTKGLPVHQAERKLVIIELVIRVRRDPRMSLDFNGLEVPVKFR